MRTELNPTEHPDEHESEALRALYAEHGQALLACGLRFTADRGRAEDLVQETFLRAWRHLPALLSDGRPIRAWLLQVMRHLLIDAERARRARPQLQHTPPMTEPAVDDGLDRLMDQAVLRQAMGQLSTDQQQIVIDTFYRDIPLTVTAQRLGVPAGTARSRLHYALVRMRRHLTPSCVAA